MSKADQPTSTSAPGLNRRHFMRTVAPTIAAVAIIPSAAYAVGSNPTPSPELQEWRTARQLYWEAIDVSHEASRRFAAAYVEHHPLRGIVEPTSMRPTDEMRAIDLYLEGPHEPLILVDEQRFIDALGVDPASIAANHQWTACEERLDAAIAVVLARPVRSWDDVAELAEMAWGESRWFAGERHPDDDHLPCRNLVALYDAVRTMSGRPMPDSAVEYGPGSDEGGADV
jgi:hypothetical protein